MKCVSYVGLIMCYIPNLNFMMTVAIGRPYPPNLAAAFQYAILV